MCNTLQTASHFQQCGHTVLHPTMGNVHDCYSAKCRHSSLHKTPCANCARTCNQVIEHVVDAQPYTDRCFKCCNFKIPPHIYRE